MIQATTNLENNRGGNGRFGSLARKRKNKKSSDSEQDFVYLDKVDTRMKFSNSKDPIYFAFETLENRTVAQLAGDFVKDTFFEITNFVSKVVK